jgi:hypothetical protein
MNAIDSHSLERAKNRFAPRIKSGAGFFLIPLWVDLAGAMNDLAARRNGTMPGAVMGGCKTRIVTIKVALAASMILLGGATYATAQQRPSIRVTPQPQSQPPAWTYPRPDTYSWPAPAPAYRQCEDWYRTEYRPSGTVITPQKRCRWVRG